MESAGGVAGDKNKCRGSRKYEERVRYGLIGNWVWTGKQTDGAVRDASTNYEPPLNLLRPFILRPYSDLASFPSCERRRRPRFGRTVLTPLGRTTDNLLRFKWRLPLDQPVTAVAILKKRK